MPTLQQLRNTIITSLKGRRIGIDNDEFLVGPKDLALATQSLTSGSTGTQVTNYGITFLDVTTAAASTASSVGTTEIGCAWAMAAPEVGVRKTIMKVSSTGGSTMPVVVSFGSGVTAYNSSFLSSASGIMLNAVGQQVTLIGVTTARWLTLSLSTGASVATS